MTLKRLLTIVFGIVGIAILLGILSLNTEMQAATVMAGEGATRPPEAPPLDPSAFLVAEVVKGGDEMLLFPQTGDAIRCNNGTICNADAPYLFQDGKLYTWVKGHKHRVWLFGVVSESRPSVQVDG
jgi:hypothetical protein